MKARDNPFATSRILRLRHRPQGWTWEGLWERVEALGFRAAIVGPHGSGKTTLLEDMEPGLLQRGFRLQRLQLDEASPRLPPACNRAWASRLTASDALLLDGAEQLSAWQWRWLRRRGHRLGALLVTSHRPGLLPTLVTCQTSADLLAELVADLLQTSPDRVRTEAHRLHEHHRGNLREALRALYDREASGRATLEAGDGRKPLTLHAGRESDGEPTRHARQ